MSFNYQARRVRDPAHPVWLRLSSLRACVRSYCRLTGVSYADLSAHLGIGFDSVPPREPPDDAFLRRTMDQVQRERNVALDRLRGWERLRVRAKMKGNRQLSGVERGALRDLGLADARVAAA
jgi:hypothetical protein